VPEFSFGALGGSPWRATKRRQAVVLPLCHVERRRSAARRFFFIHRIGRRVGFQPAPLVDPASIRRRDIPAGGVGGGGRPLLDRRRDVGKQLNDAMTALTQKRHPGAEDGNIGSAAGVHFTSFPAGGQFSPFVRCRSQRLEVDVLGLSKVALATKNPNPVVYIELELEASFKARVGACSPSAAS